MSARPPRLDGDQIAAHVAVLSREPFRQVLELFLQAAPDVDSVAEFAKRYPDRWAQALIMIGKLSGFHERMQVDHEHRHLVAIHEMSDMELMQRLHKVMKQLGIQSDRLPDMRKLRLVANGKSDAGE